MASSNNTNKLSPQELLLITLISGICSNNTNKLSPQEQVNDAIQKFVGSNNTNKLSPQEHKYIYVLIITVQIIQINLVLKNPYYLIWLILAFK